MIEYYYSLLSKELVIDEQFSTKGDRRLMPVIIGIALVNFTRCRLSIIELVGQRDLFWR